MVKTAKILGVIAGIASIILWIIMKFYNPYSAFEEYEPAMNTFMMLLLPACLAVLGSFSSQYIFMFIAFLWSLPISAFLVFTPGIFALFGLTCIAYLVCFLLRRFAVKRNNDTNLS
ncbi:hypothetical protein [Virgibacillus doumboii]|uniref:hypothetical protein n=1 Tax=Virgibacillus doumboii TaxID=2697503 RepID=UPI0013E069AB|nr:hypothetical protein [Virgibacillus doumboii]